MFTPGKSGEYTRWAWNWDLEIEIYLLKSGIFRVCHNTPRSLTLPIFKLFMVDMKIVMKARELRVLWF